MKRNSETQPAPDSAPADEIACAPASTAEKAASMPAPPTVGTAPAPASPAAEAPCAPVSPAAETARGTRVPAPPATNEHVRKSMQGNKRANTKPELIMRERLRAAGLGGYRLQWKVPGHPDITWPGKRVALFINGCFWHRCPHCHPSTPKSHVEYWVMKFDRNVERDAENRTALEEAGWTVHTVWECQLKKKTIDETLAQLFPILAKELGKELKNMAEQSESEGNSQKSAN